MCKTETIRSCTSRPTARESFALGPVLAGLAAVIVVVLAQRLLAAIAIEYEVPFEPVEQPHGRPEFEYEPAVAPLREQPEPAVVLQQRPAAVQLRGHAQLPFLAPALFV